uniref:Uncharacterized protein n=1 Tax=Kalanchoe fedtschenkoi TaxID=63787 RepID=A0A7N0U091_KALFE
MSLCKMRLHIGKQVKDTSPKLMQASEIDYNTQVSVSADLNYLKHMDSFWFVTLLLKLSSCDC